MRGEGVNPALDVSRETNERLKAYEALLRKWNAKINLVSRTTLDDIWSRHFLDSAQLYALAPAGARHWADLGSGGGFPGLVAAVLAAGEGRDLTMTLVESDQRKAAFLAAAGRELGLKLDVRAERIERLPPLAADVVSARALAPLTDLLGFAERHLGAGGMALFPKGATYAEELTSAERAWRFSVDTIPSKTDPLAVVLSVTEISRA